MVTAEELAKIVKETDEFLEEIGPEARARLAKAIHQGQLELKKSRALAQHQAYERMLAWKDRCCLPMGR